MQTIHKFALMLHWYPGSITLQLPHDAKVLTVQLQGNSPVIWVQLDPEARRAPRQFSVVGTGWEMEHTHNYIGTWQEDASVWHLFEHSR